MRISHVIDTHVHADHRSGGPRARRRTGAQRTACTLGRRRDRTFEPLDRRTGDRARQHPRDGSCTRPGTRPRAISLVVTPTCAAAPIRGSCCTGDTLFVGAVGRPDLPGRAQENAGELHRQHSSPSCWDAARRARGLPGALRRLGLRCRDERQAQQHPRLRASDGTRCSPSTATPSSTRSATCRPKPADDGCRSCDSTGAARDDRAAAPRPAREPRAVHAAGRRQRLRRRDDRHGAQHPAGDRRAGVPPRARTAVLSFIVVFGVDQGADQLPRGPLSDRFGRKHDPRRRLAGRRAGAVPADVGAEWNWVLVANVLLGVSQGLTWSTTVIMKIDLAGPANAAWRWASTSSPATSRSPAPRSRPAGSPRDHGLRPEPFYLGVGFVALGLGLSLFAVRETRHHVAHEARQVGAAAATLSPREVFWRTTWRDRNLASVSQAGLVNNLNDGMAWGLFPLFFAAAHLDIDQIGMARGDLPGDLGRRADLHRRALGSRRPQVVDRQRHVGAGDRDRHHRARGRLRRLRPRLRAARRRHGDGLSDAARGDRRRRPSLVAGVGGRRLSPVARPRLRRRRGARGAHRRRARPRRRDVGRRRPDPRLRPPGRATHAPFSTATLAGSKPFAVTAISTCE
jgi:hypothetical protein